MKQKPLILNILVLFAGAGLATRGLLDAGHTCTDVEIQPEKSYLSEILNPEATHIVSDVMDLDPDWIATFDAVWASPPCQKRSGMNQGRDLDAIEKYNKHDDLLEWSLSLKNNVLWVENVVDNKGRNNWGKRYNAAQFETRQLRTRIIGGRYRNPAINLPYKPSYLKSHNIDICPAVLATEITKSAIPSPKSGFIHSEAAYWYGRTLSLSEVAWHQGIDKIPHELLKSWWYPLDNYTYRQWKIELCEAIGNGVPVYMAKAFGEAYSYPDKGIRQMPLLDL